MLWLVLLCQLLAVIVFFIGYGIEGWSGAFALFLGVELCTSPLTITMHVQYFKQRAAKKAENERKQKRALEVAAENRFNEQVNTYYKSIENADVLTKDIRNRIVWYYQCNYRHGGIDSYNINEKWDVLNSPINVDAPTVQLKGIFSIRFRSEPDGDAIHISMPGDYLYINLHTLGYDRVTEKYKQAALLIGTKQQLVNEIWRLCESKGYKVAGSSQWKNDYSDIILTCNVEYPNPNYKTGLKKL